MNIETPLLGGIHLKPVGSHATNPFSQPFQPRIDTEPLEDPLAAKDSEYGISLPAVGSHATNPFTKIPAETKL